MAASNVDNQSELRYSDRQRLARDGSLGALKYDTIPEGILNAVLNIVEGLTGTGKPPAGYKTESGVKAELAQHFGLRYEPTSLATWFRQAPMLDFLDGVEILVEHAQVVWQRPNERGQAAVPDIVARFNRLAQRHRFGYQLDSQGRIRRIGSEALDQYVALPALQAVKRPGWEEVERIYREALDHQRGGPAEMDDALTAANSAVESALKAAGLKGDRLGSLVKSFKTSNLVPGQLKATPEALDVLTTLLQRSGAIRDAMGDAHGSEPGAEAVPQELADLAIYWAGAFINYLAAAVERREVYSG